MRRRLLWLGGIMVGILVLAGAYAFSEFLGARLGPGEVFRVGGPDVLLIGEPAIVSWEATSAEAAALASVKIEFCSSGGLLGGECVTLNPDTPNDGKAQVFVPSTLSARRGTLRLTAREMPRGPLLGGVGASHGVELRRGTELSPGQRVVASWQPDGRYPEVKIEFCVPGAAGEACTVLAHRAANTGLSPTLTVTGLRQRMVGTIRVRARDINRQLVTDPNIRLRELPAAVVRKYEEPEAQEGPYFEPNTGPAQPESAGEGLQQAAEPAESTPFSIEISDVAVSQVTESALTVSFNTAPAADEGELHVRPLGKDEWTILDDYPVPSSTFTYTATGLVSNTVYEYKARAAAHDPACRENCELVTVESPIFQVTTDKKPQPDLVIESIEPTVEKRGKRYNVEFEVVVKNRGTREAEKSHTRIEIDEDLDGDIDRWNSNSTPKIKAGGSEEESWTMWNFEAGMITVQVCADVLKRVEELDETNNCLTTEVVIGK